VALTAVVHVSLDTRASGAVTGTWNTGGGAQTWTLPAALYPDLVSLAAALQTAFRTAPVGPDDNDWTVVLAGIGDGSSGISVAHAGGAFDATFPPVLQDHGGWASAYVAVTSAVGSPNGWWPSLPVADPDCFYPAERYHAPAEGALVDVVADLGERRWFTGQLQFDRDDVAEFRTFIGHALRGRAFRLFLNWADQTAWSESNRDGYLDLRFGEADKVAAEAWLDEPNATFGAFALESPCVDYSGGTAAAANWRNPQQGRVIHGLHIGGCPALFRSATLRGPTGAAWAAPTCAVNVARSFSVETALDDREGIEAHPEEWTPLEGVTKGGGMTLRLLATSDVITLFGYEDTAIDKTLLAADLDYDTGAAQRTVTVEDTSAFTLPGAIYIGHEAIWAPNTGGATTFGATDCERGLYAWRSDSRLDTPHVCNLDTQGDLPEPVTDRPINWPGRRVTVLQWACDDEGNALDTAYRGTHETEVFSGWIDTIEFEGTHVVLYCKALAQRVCESEIGRGKTGALVGGDWYPMVWV